MRGLGMLFTLAVISFLLIGCSTSADVPASVDAPPAVGMEEQAAVNVDEADIPALVVKNDDRFTAQALAGGTVSLNWLPIDGAEKYLLEILLDDESLLPVAMLSKEALNYEDVDLPAETDFIYQLTAVTGSERKDSRRVGVQTLPVIPDPITVTLEFDQTQPLFDTTNFDPNNFDPEILATMFPADEEGEGEPITDMSMFMASPVTATALIGPDGGEVSVTGSNELVYTLSVPPGAFMFEVPITLKPISAIPDLPLSGGLDAAVMIEPEGIPLLAPATLTIYAPEGYTPSTGELDLGFAFTAEGAEFHLYPLVEDDAQARTGVRMAKVAPKPKSAGPLAQIAQQQLDQFMGFGKGSGSKEDVKKVNNKPSSKAKHRAAASAVAAKKAGKFVQPLEEAFDEELTPLMTPQELALAKFGESIRQKANSASNMEQLMAALEDFQLYYETGGEQFNKNLNKRILDALVEASYNLLQKNFDKCLSAEDLKTQSYVERLVNGKGAAISAISARFKEKYGTKLLNDLHNGMKLCIYELGFTSSVSYEVEKSVWFTSTTVEPFPLAPLFASGDLFLWGSGLMKQEQSISGTCSAPVTQYDNLKFVVQKLEPVFEDSVLKDFALIDYFVSGMEQLKGVEVAGETCIRSIKYKGGGDFWSAFFAMARATTGQFELRNWKIEGDVINGSSVTAKWEHVKPTFNPVGEPGKLTEDSKFTLTIKKIK